MDLRLCALSLFLLAACKDKPDVQKVFADLEAVNARACACKDEACLIAASGEYGKIVSPVLGGKDKETVTKLGELQTKHDNCAKKVMGGGIDHK